MDGAMPRYTTCGDGRPQRRKIKMAKYGAKASEKIERAIDKMQAGTLKSGQSDKPVKSRAQAIAIGLSEARHEGGKVPPKSAGKPVAKRAAANTTSATQKTQKKAVAKKATAKRARKKAAAATA